MGDTAITGPICERCKHVIASSGCACGVIGVGRIWCERCAARPKMANCEWCEICYFKVTAPERVCHYCGKIDCKAGCGNRSIMLIKALQESKRLLEERDVLKQQRIVQLEQEITRLKAQDQLNEQAMASLVISHPDVETLGGPVTGDYNDTESFR